MVFRFFLLFLGSAFAVCVAVAGLMEESSNQFLVEWVGDSCSGSCGHSFFSRVGVDGGRGPVLGIMS
jgi:hypothetical protein